MKDNSKVLILCHAIKDNQFVREITERLESVKLQPIFHEETSLSMDSLRVISEIEAVDYLVVINEGNIRGDFLYEIGYAQAKWKPIFLIQSQKNIVIFPDILAIQMLDIHDSEDRCITSLPQSKVKLFVEKILTDNIDLKIIYGHIKDTPEIAAVG